MSEVLCVRGGVPLHGNIKVGGAKNATLPILIATLLASEPCTISNVPKLEDVAILLRLLEHFGARTKLKDDSAEIYIPEITAADTSYSLVKALRASFWVLGPLLARKREAHIALPGGDLIGARPVDLHLSALTQMGAEIQVKNGAVHAVAPGGLRSAEIEFKFPSVGATHQVLMAAALTPGRTVIRNAAREPEVVALADFITRLGAKVEGAGTSDVIIFGEEKLGGAHLALIGDRIEAATYALAALATGGCIQIDGFNAQYFGEFLEILDNLGAKVTVGNDFVQVLAQGRIKALHVQTGPFPHFATDMHPVLMAAMTLADGESSITENIFEGRFGHVAELSRFGAQIVVNGRVARIKGVPKLSGAPVDAHDIRAGAALVVAALAAEGETVIHEIHHLRRGYASIESKLSNLGARIESQNEDLEDTLLVGC